MSKLKVSLDPDGAVDIDIKVEMSGKLGLSWFGSREEVGSFMQIYVV